MMKTRLRAAIAATCLLTFVGAASAQDYGGGGPPPPPPGYHGGGGGEPGSWGFVQRRGFTIGIGGSLGGMSSASDDLTECFDCDYTPVMGAFDAHLGAMISPRLAIMGEVFVPAQVIDDEFADFLVQPMLFAALQYWVTPQLWLKGGLGVASLQISYSDGGPNDELDTGGAVMGAVGFEVLQAPRFTVDINLRLTSTSYNGIDDQIATGSVGIGANWY
jgi:hypothetical protein